MILGMSRGLQFNKNWKLILKQVIINLELLLFSSVIPEFKDNKRTANHCDQEWDRDGHVDQQFDQLGVWVLVVVYQHVERSHCFVVLECLD